MFFLIPLFLLFLSCGQDVQWEDYELQSPADLGLTQSNHAYGYGSDQCFFCHVERNIHRHNSTGSPLLDLAREKTESAGIESCSLCHGDNGVTP